MKTLFPIRKKRKTLIRAGSKSGEKKADRTGAITNQIGEPAASPLDDDLIEKNRAKHKAKSPNPNGHNHRANPTGTKHTTKRKQLHEKRMARSIRPEANKKVQNVAIRGVGPPRPTCDSIRRPQA